MLQNGAVLEEQAPTTPLHDVTQAPVEENSTNVSQTNPFEHEPGVQPQMPAVVQTGALVPPSVHAHWVLPLQAQLPLGVQVIELGQSEAKLHCPQVPPEHPGLLKGQSAAERHWTHSLTVALPGVLSQRSVLTPPSGATQSEFARHSTQVSVVVSQTPAKHVWTPHALPPASNPPVGPQTPTSQLGLLAGHSLSESHKEHGPTAPGVQNGVQAPSLHPSPVGQSAKVRHWTQLPVQNSAPPSAAWQSLSTAHWAQPRKVQMGATPPPSWEHWLFSVHWRQIPYCSELESVWHWGYPVLALHPWPLVAQFATHAPLAYSIVLQASVPPSVAAQSEAWPQPHVPASGPLQTGASPPQSESCTHWHVREAPQVMVPGQSWLVRQVPQRQGPASPATHPGLS